MSKINTRETAPIVEDFDFSMLENCDSAPVDLIIDSYIGFRKNPFLCQEPDNIEIFEQGVDYELIDPDILTMTINRDEISTNSAFKQTSSVDLEASVTLPIQVKANSRLLEYMILFNMNEDSSGRKGRGLLALSDGGVSLYRRFTYNKGQVNEYIIQEEAMNLKLATWFDPIAGNFDSDTSVDIELMMEYWANYQIIGLVQQNFGLPEAKTGAVITFDTPTFDGTTIDIANLTLIDDENISYDGLNYVTIYNELMQIVDTQSIETGSSYQYTVSDPFEKLFYCIWYKRSETLAITVETKELEETTMLPPKKATKNVKKED